MSLSNVKKTLVEKLKEQETMTEALTLEKTELTKVIETLKAQSALAIDERVNALQTELEQVKSATDILTNEVLAKGQEIADLQAIKEKLEAEKVDLAKAVEDAKAEAAKVLTQVADEQAKTIEAIKAKAVETEQAKDKEIAELKTKLANPAYAMATDGRQEAVADGANVETIANLYQQYKAISDPRAKAKFWVENERQIMEQSKQGVK